MSEVKVSRTVTVVNPQGIHARPADLIVRLAQQYQSKIEFVKENQRVEGKSILELLTLAAMPNEILVIEATGDDAQQAVDALCELIASGFGDEENKQE